MKISFKKPLAAALAVVTAVSLAPTAGLYSADVTAQAATKNAVTAKSTSVKVTKANTIKINKAKAAYKITVSVSGTAKSGVTVKYGSKTLVKAGKTLAAGKKKVVAKKTAFNLKATATQM